MPSLFVSLSFSGAFSSCSGISGALVVASKAAPHSIALQDSDFSWRRDVDQNRETRADAHSCETPLVL